MNTNDLLGLLILSVPVLTAVGAMVGAALVKNYKPARDAAIVSADYVEAVKEAVETAERYGIANRLPGFEKAAVAIREMDTWLESCGIHGDAKLVTLERVKSDIELMRLRLFPKVAA